MEHDRRKTPNLPHKYGPYLHPKIEKHVENLPTVTTPSLKRVYFVSREFFLSGVILVAFALFGRL